MLMTSTWRASANIASIKSLLVCLIFQRYAPNWSSLRDFVNITTKVYALATKVNTLVATFLKPENSTSKVETSSTSQCALGSSTFSKFGGWEEKTSGNIYWESNFIFSPTKMRFLAMRSSKTKLSCRRIASAL